MDDALPDGSSELISRPPQREDVVGLCRELNRLGAKYVVIGGLAVIEAGYPRTTGDIDLLVDPALENEAKIFDALATLPVSCVRDLDGVKIPFANPDLLWRMKCRTHRAKDQGDLVFLRELFQAEGRQPPESL